MKKKETKRNFNKNKMKFKLILKIGIMLFLIGVLFFVKFYFFNKKDFILKFNKNKIEKIYLNQDKIKEETSNNNFNGIRRKAIIDFPDKHSFGKKYPILIVLHSSGGNYNQTHSMFGKLANEETFIGIYPQGVNNKWNSFIKNSTKNEVDDVYFISKLIDYSMNNFNVDKNKIYVVGFSNGGSLAQKLGIKLSDKISAVVSISASLEKGLEVENNSTVSIMQINSKKDKIIPYKGGKGVNDNEFLSAENSIKYWAKRSNCDIFPNKSDLNQNYIEFNYENCDNQSKVKLISVLDSGHHISQKIGEMPLIDFIWNFLKNLE